MQEFYLFVVVVSPLSLAQCATPKQQNEYPSIFKLYIKMKVRIFFYIKNNSSISIAAHPKQPQSPVTMTPAERMQL